MTDTPIYDQLVREMGEPGGDVWVTDTTTWDGTVIRRDYEPVQLPPPRKPRRKPRTKP